MIGYRRTHHFNAANFSIFNEERLRDQDAGRAIEPSERIRPSVRKNTRVDGSLVEHDMRPHDAPFLVDDWISPIMDILDDEVITQFKLRKAIHCKAVDCVR